LYSLIIINNRYLIKEAYGEGKTRQDIYHSLFPLIIEVLSLTSPNFPLRTIKLLSKISFYENYIVIFELQANKQRINQYKCKYLLY